MRRTILTSRSPRGRGEPICVDYSCGPDQRLGWRMRRRVRTTAGGEGRGGLGGDLGGSRRAAAGKGWREAEGRWRAAEGEGTGRRWEESEGQLQGWAAVQGIRGRAWGRAAANSHKGGQRGRGRVQLSEVSMDRGRAEAGQTVGTRRAQSRDRDGRGGTRLGR